jgi:ribosomal protein S3
LAVLPFVGAFIRPPQPSFSLYDSDEPRLCSACYGVLRFIMESGAKGCEVVVSGKLRAARAKSMKFTDGFMIHSGQPARDFVDEAVRHVLMRQGVLGIKVKMSVPTSHNEFVSLPI